MVMIAAARTASPRSTHPTTHENGAGGFTVHLASYRYDRAIRKGNAGLLLWC